MANTVSFRIKIDDSDSFKTVTGDADEFAEVLDEIIRKAKNLNGELVNAASVSQILEAAGNAVSNLASAFDSLSRAYYEDEEAANTLAQVMSNTMDATEENVQEIMRFVEAQERVGVVSAGVQTAAARELSTYLTMTDSLKTLIPVLNDMGVHQYGVAVSGEQLTQIATMMGKVMDGQTEALSRAGYKFDEAQKHILQFGEESERAAVLAQVVSDSVGGINASSVETAAGKMQRFRNQMEGMKSTIGSVVSSLNPFIQGLAGLVVIVANVAQLRRSFEVLNKTMAVAKLRSLGLAAAQKVQATAQKLLAAAGYQAAAGTTALRIATAALYAALSLGLTVAIQAIIGLVARLASRSNDAAGGLEKMDEATEAFKNTSASMRAELAQEIVALETLIKKKGQDADKVAELNERYGEAFGYHQSAVEWYEILISKSADYCRQLAYEAKAKVYASQSGEKQVELDEVRSRKKELEDTGQTRKGIIFTTEYERLCAKEKILEQEVADLDAGFRSATQSARDLSDSLTKGMDDGTASVKWQEMNLEQLNTAIKEQETNVTRLAGTNEKEAKSEAAVLKAMKARKDALEKTYGLSSQSGNTGAVKNGESLIENASSYEALANNIKYYQNQLEKTDASDTAAIRTLAAKIQNLQKAQKAIRDVTDAASRPATLDTLEDIDREITYQQGLRRTASKENLAQIDAEIARLNALKTAFEQTQYIPPKLEDIKTYKQLGDEIELCSKALQTAESGNREQIQLTLNALEKLRKEWDGILARLEKPGDISTLNTVESLEEAISYYSAEQKKQTQEEALATQVTLNALQAKKNTMESILSLPAAKQEISNLGGLSGQSLRMELELIGFDGIRNKIRDLQKLLDDTENPLGEEQRADVENMIASYRNYEKVLKKSGKVSDGMAEGIGAIGSVMGSLSGVVSESTGAWLQWGANLCQAIAQAIPMLATLFAANTAVAGSGAASSVASIPIVGPILAVAAVASIIAAIASLPKFADGGIAYGPTLGLFGEYAGASNNPEVVAPLDRLRALISDSVGGLTGDVRFEIEGSKLVGILQRRHNLLTRTNG